MFKLFAKKEKDDVKDFDALAKLIKDSPKALQAFEDEYWKSLGASGSSNFYDITVKELSEEVRTASIGEYDEGYLAGIISRIVDELAGITSGFIIKDGRLEELCFPQPSAPPVIMEELEVIPEGLRPMLTGRLCMRDLSGESCRAVLDMLMRSQKETDPVKKRQFYGRFRQGLEILDLDPVLYEILGRNRNNMGYWLPAIAEAAGKEGFFKIPDTVLVQVPLPILQLTRLEYTSLNLTTLKIVDEWAMKVFGLDIRKEYFIKTGVFSSKYDFRNARVAGEKEVRELGEYLLFIQHQATMYAGYFNMDKHGRSLSIYGAATTNQFAVRDFIQDREENPAIYNGLPLHTEYRVFVQFGQEGRILGISPYWRPDIMKGRFSKMKNGKEKHDYIMYLAHEETLMARYEENKDKVLFHLERLLEDVKLEGQWSVDVMQNGDDFYIIDMAAADASALNDCVPKELLKKSPENWISNEALFAICAKEEKGN